MQILREARIEGARLSELARYRILDTDAEPAFDRLTVLAARLLKTPIALVSFVDAKRQWFKSKVGLDAPSTPREHAFCAHTIRGDGLFEVEDAQADERFADNPLVTGAPRIRFYAGAPLITPHGFKLGSLCVIDRKPRRLSDAERATLVDLAALTVAELELRRSLEAERETRVALESHDRTKGLFMSRMSHEMRTPLTGILGAADVLLDGRTSDPEGHLHLVRNAARDLADIISEVQDHAAIESGTVVLKPEWTSLEREAEKIIRRAGPLAHDKGLELRVTAPLGLDYGAEVECDSLRLRQIVLELVHNAIKFTERGRVTLDMRVGRPDRDGDAPQLFLSVLDTGLGMDAGALEKAFAAYAQGDERLERANDGTGLGLALVKRLTELMGGSISVRTALGEGSEFSVALPVEARASDTLAVSSENAPLAELGPLSGIDLLLVEDNRAIRTIAGTMLSELGCTLRTAVDGESGVASALEKAPDAILMDLHMPGITGYEAARRIRNALGSQTPPILAMTADDEARAMTRDEADMLDGYIAKPIEWPRLVQTLLAFVPPVQSVPAE